MSQIYWGFPYLQWCQDTKKYAELNIFTFYKGTANWGQVVLDPAAVRVSLLAFNVCM